MRRTVRFLALGAVSAAALAGGAGPAGAEWLLDADAGLLYEDNLSHAATERDARADLALVPALSAGRSFQLADSTGLQAAATLRGALHATYAGLDHVAPGLAAGLRQKFGLGAFAPWARAFASAAWASFADDALDSGLFDAGLEVGQRLHARVAVRAGYRFDARAGNSPPFDLAGHAAFVAGSLAVTGTTDLVLGYSTRWGDFTVHRAAAGAPPPGARLVQTFGSPMFAFPIDATTYAASAMLSRALGERWSANVGYEYRFTQGPRLDYTDHAVRASVGYRY